MIFDYCRQDYSVIPCRNCGAEISCDKIPFGCDVSADGLPAGHEREFLLESFDYCQVCGYAWSGYKHLKLFSPDVINPGLSKAEAAKVIYGRYATNKYILGTLYEFLGDMETAEKLWAEYLEDEHPLDNIEQLGVHDRLEFADIYRRLGMFDEAQQLIHKLNTNNFWLPEYALKQQKKFIRRRSTARIVIPNKYTLKPQ